MKEQNTQRTNVNLAHFHCDAVEQYDRKENVDYHEIAEVDGETDQQVMDAVHVQTIFYQIGRKI